MLKRYNYYRLVDGTIEIDGIRMHQTANKTPIQDAIDKVNLIPLRKNFIVLDICTGLGYSAITISKKVKTVITIENDPYVLELARKNTLSEELFKKENIFKIIGHAEELISSFPNNYFHAIFHDPPRLKRSGLLYSQVFYEQLFRVLKNKGWLFHYTGKPGSKSGKNIPKGVKKRLSLAGFKDIVWHEGCLGFTARKY